MRGASRRVEVHPQALDGTTPFDSEGRPVIDPQDPFEVDAVVGSVSARALEIALAAGVEVDAVARVGWDELERAGHGISHLDQIEVLDGRTLADAELAGRYEVTATTSTRTGLRCFIRRVDRG